MFFDSYELLIKYICDNSNEKEIYIWGVSVYGNYLGILLNEKNIKWSGYFDNYSVDINKQCMGDDLNGLDIIKKAEWSACPNDGVKPVKEVCNFVASKNGGGGAVREAIEALLEYTN